MVCNDAMVSKMISLFRSHKHSLGMVQVGQFLMWDSYSMVQESKFLHLEFTLALTIFK